jgi:two-component system CheB/CheR fusion protein
MAAKKRAKAPESTAEPRLDGHAATPHEPAAQSDAAGPESIPTKPCLAIVGIGASAGGLDAFRRLFAAMPAESGIAFVLVPHLDPAHESLMVELLAHHTGLPVVKAENNMPVQADHVYITPPNNYITIHSEILRLTGPVERGTSQTTIDRFLCSLADDLQERSICIILSGTGAHGTLGLKAVKAAGGMAMVQEPLTAEYERMPQSAIATGLADYVLPVEKMPEALVRYVQHAHVNGCTPIAPVLREANGLTQVLALLRGTSKFDFCSYRKQMLTRRIERRMRLNHLGDVPEYMAFLRDHPEELKQLARDLFISVTRFFRDPEAFGLLSTRVIEPLVERKGADGMIRVWVPGCATGEEPYSIAILVLEHIAASKKSCRLQVFATDVDVEALDVARQGLYSDSIAADVSPERLTRFFSKVDEHTYRVGSALRESVIFAPQNLLHDAPFTRLDLVSCRKLLIYLEPDVQQKVITLFHFALTEGGNLFLGPSETIGRQIDQFEPISRKWRIYRRIGDTRLDRMNFPIVAAPETRELRCRTPESAGKRPINLAQIAERLLLEHFAPTAVLINRKYEILFYFGSCEQYLKTPGGLPTHDVILTAREGLGSKLRAAIDQAIHGNETVVLTRAKVKRTSGYHPVRVTVRPIHAPEAVAGLLFVTFQEEVPSAQAADPSAQQAAAETGDESAIRQLEFELKATREDLQSTIEEMESSNEELQVSNEEVMLMNEELQSANEELQTSKEELQSLNEELTMVNNQLQEKVQELQKTSNDMANLFNSTGIATVFLDASMRIKRFTPAATKLFNLIASDIGRPIADITHRHRDPDLLEDARLVLQHLVPREREVDTQDATRWIRRIVPYRTVDDHIEGLVLTFNDVTLLQLNEALERKVRERTAALRESEARLAFELDATTRLHEISTLFVRDGNVASVLGKIVEAAIAINQADMGIIQLLDKESGTHKIVAQRGFEQLFLDFWNQNSGGHGACGTAVAQGERVVVEDVTSSLIFARTAALPIMLEAGARSVQSTPLRSRSTKLLGALSTHCRTPSRPTERALHFFDLLASQAADIIERALAEDELNRMNESLEQQVDERTRSLREREEELRSIHDNAFSAIITIDPEGIIHSVNPATEAMFGYSASEILGKNIKMLMPPRYGNEHDGYLQRFMLTGEVRIIGTVRELRATRKDGSEFDVALSVNRMDRPDRYIGILMDITRRKELEREVVEIATLEHQRIGQDLHDECGQQLTALGLLADSLVSMLHATDPRGVALARKIETGLQNVSWQIRGISHGLVRSEVAPEQLRHALAELAGHLRESSGIRCDFHGQSIAPQLDAIQATHLYHIAQEACINAVKHASAQNIAIRLRASDHAVTLQVQDDGNGIPPDAPQGLGQRVMRNRASVIGAELSIEPAKPQGTTVTCTMHFRPGGSLCPRDQSPQREC